MFGCKRSVVVLTIFIGASLSAQTPARPTDPVFVRAQALVSDGNGAAGRALIDSMIAATPPSAPLYPQALFWRASLAASAADAESDYKHIVVDYPLTPQAPDALLRLAQLELARGDRDAAIGHLQRVPRDYPHSKSLARANYWIARVFFEKNDLANGCAANASALAQLDSSEIELRNQIQYQGQRCPAPGSPSTVSTVQPTATQTQSTANQAQPTASESQAPAALQTKPAPVTSASAVVNTLTTEKSVEAKRPTPPAEANDAKPSVVDPTPKAEYSVQVAAYRTRADAYKLTANLRNRGYEARVDSAPDWFRVRIGRYPKESDAERQLREMKTKQMSGFVVRAPER